MTTGSPKALAVTHAQSYKRESREDLRDWTLNVLREEKNSSREWRTVEGPGFTIAVDKQHQSPTAFALSIVRGLDSRPRRLDPSYLYDEVGSKLFERITEQPEYYLTRAEDRLLVRHSAEIRRVAGAGTLVELGSGASLKTQRLLDAWTRAGKATYVPVDVDENAIAEACTSLRARYPDLTMRGVASTYERALATLKGTGAKTIAFLGSSLGNLSSREYQSFCELIATTLSPGDHFLVGLDLVKRPEVIEAAYNDAAGITAAFTRNLFARMNRELNTSIPETAIHHVAYYDVERERIEIFAEALEELTISVPSLEREFRIARGERILTEVSHKFRPETFIATVEEFGLEECWRTDDEEFGIFLFRKPKNAMLAGSPSSRSESARSPLPPSLHARTHTRNHRASRGRSDRATAQPSHEPHRLGFGAHRAFRGRVARPGREENVREPRALRSSCNASGRAIEARSPDSRSRTGEPREHAKARSRQSSCIRDRFGEVEDARIDRWQLLGPPRGAARSAASRDDSASHRTS